MPFHIALLGNPNCGKTTLFNAVTGASQYVGNWPGVTVEKKEGRFRRGGLEVVMVDLPGIYSLSPYTPEEIVSRQYITDEQPDLIVNIVDATNLERNLYLTTQLAELGRPMIIALNMIDMLERRGVSVDTAALEKEMGIPICPISASKSTGVDQLLHRAIHMLHDISHEEDVAGGEGQLKSRAAELHRELHHIHGDLHENRLPYHPIVKTFYDWKISAAVEAVEEVIRDLPGAGSAPRFAAVKLFEGDPILTRGLPLSAEQRRLVEGILASVPETPLVDRQMMIADQRYRFICGVCGRVVKKPRKPVVTLSEKIDRVLTHKALAIPLFFVIMLVIFIITFGPPGSWLTDTVSNFISGSLTDGVRQGLTSVHTAQWAVSLLCDGILGGVGSVLSFLPQIMILFFFLSILEDSGYMSRAAFIMDRPLRKIGLTGRSFVPMLMGFGCTVPAVMATRTLENERDKRLTVLITPFMSCSAKMPVYALFISAFFAKNKPLVIFSIYLLGIFVAILAGFILKRTALKGENATFVMELPPYRLPTLKGLCIHIWERLKDFLSKAGTVLLAASVIIWFLQSFNTSLEMVDDSSRSILAAAGTAIAPVFVPLGFGFWQASVALVSGLAAKETVVSTFGILLGAADETASAAALNGVFTPLSAFSFLVFVLLYTPCFAALSAIRREMRSWKWTLFAIVMQLGVAWVCSFAVYQGGRLLGLG